MTGRLEIRRIEPKDYSKAAKFAAVGMNFQKYTRGKLERLLYSRYFWYSELLRATCSYAAYDGDMLEGVLLATVDGEKRTYNGLKGRAYVAILGPIAKKSEEDYYGANEAIRSGCQEHLDGEITFLATNPEHTGRGVGTALLDAFEKDHPGRNIYLFSDDTCTYQFYEHRGFRKVGERTITESDGRTRFPLRCFMYVKHIGP